MLRIRNIYFIAVMCYNYRQKLKGEHRMKAIITVLGKDQVGIIAGVSSLLAKWNVNVLDISQTILQENFTMVMLADLENCSLSFTELTEKLSALGAEMDIAIRMQREDIFNAMHKI